MPDGEAIVEDRLQEEESRAEDALSELEDVDVDSAEFGRKLAVLKNSVIAHCESEEGETPSRASRCDTVIRRAETADRWLQ